MNPSFQVLLRSRMRKLSPQLNLLVIRCQDIHRSKKFYELLGLEFELHRHGNGPEHYATTNSETVFELYTHRDSQPSTFAVRFGFRISSLDQHFQLLVDAGGQLVSSPNDSEWGKRAVLKDLDGHTIELIEQPFQADPKERNI